MYNIHWFSASFSGKIKGWHCMANVKTTLLYGILKITELYGSSFSQDV